MAELRQNETKPWIVWRRNGEGYSPEEHDTLESAILSMTQEGWGMPILTRAVKLVQGDENTIKADFPKTPCKNPSEGDDR